MSNDDYLAREHVADEPRGDRERPRRFPAWAYQPPYSHLATVRGHLDIPVRREGRYWVCAVQVDYGYWWAPSDVRDVRPLP